MSAPIITVENLGKSYLVGHQGQRERYTALRDVIVRNGKDLWRKTRDIMRGKQLVQGDETEEFWALKNVSFEVQQGEVLGIIGRNGAGKSTLLKILSRITEPTEGRVTLRGRVASLLEVGTGFHPELTGRENIFLNGAILGMTKAEIKKKFDEIVDFAEVEMFLDTPVKRYSSGMYVRLAFAVAAHLEPEILIVDEVLAVGDAEFQKKCLGKMQDVSKGGRTVLFVSHNMVAVQQLCTKGMLLAKGGLRVRGDVGQVVNAYSQKQSDDGVGFKEFPPLRPEREACIRSISTHSLDGVLRSEFAINEPFAVKIAYESRVQLRHGVIGCQVRSASGVAIFTSHWNDMPPNKDVEIGKHTVLCLVERNCLMPGEYYLEAGIADRAVRVLDLKTDFVSFRVLNETKFRPQPMDSRPGQLYFDLNWKFEN